MPPPAPAVAHPPNPAAPTSRHLRTSLPAAPGSAAARGPPPALARAPAPTSRSSSAHTPPLSSRDFPEFSLHNRGHRPPAQSANVSLLSLVRCPAGLAQQRRCLSIDPNQPPAPSMLPLVTHSAGTTEGLSGARLSGDNSGQRQTGGLTQKLQNPVRKNQMSKNILINYTSCFHRLQGLESLDRD